jgi:hypothetical protein
MNRHENLKIVAFIGTNTSAIVERLTEMGYPKVSSDDMVSQIQHLDDAGQHRIVTDQLTDFELYKKMRHAFPSEITLVGITDKEKMAHYLAAKSESPINWDDLDSMQEIDLLMQADFYLELGSDKQLDDQIAAFISEHDFRL